MHTLCLWLHHSAIYLLCLPLLTFMNLMLEISLSFCSNRPYSAPAKRPAKRGPRCVSHDKPSSLDLDIALYSPRPLPHVSKTISPGVPNLQRGRSSDSGSTNRYEKYYILHTSTILHANIIFTSKYEHKM